MVDSSSSPDIYSSPQGKDAEALYPPTSRHISEPLGRPTSKALEPLWVKDPGIVTPYQGLVPDMSDAEIARLDRRSQVAIHVGSSVLKQANFRDPSHAYRPKNISERVMAWRMHQKIGKATLRSMEVSKISEPYLELRTIQDPDNPRKLKEVKLPNFGQNWNKLSWREKKRVKKDEKRFNKLNRQVNRLVNGRKLPTTDKRVMGFEQIVNQTGAGEVMRRPGKAVKRAWQKRK